MYSKKELVAKGFIPHSARAAMVSPHTPPERCSTQDYQKLPPEVKSKYSPQPTGAVHIRR